MWVTPENVTSAARASSDGLSFQHDRERAGVGRARRRSAYRRFRRRPSGRTLRQTRLRFEGNVMDPPLQLHLTQLSTAKQAQRRTSCYAVVASKKRTAHRRAQLFSRRLCQLRRGEPTVRPEGTGSACNSCAAVSRRHTFSLRGSIHLPLVRQGRAGRAATRVILFLSDRDGQSGRDGPLLERDRRQWRHGKPVRLVQGPLGPLLAEITPRALTEALGLVAMRQSVLRGDDAR